MSDLSLNPHALEALKRLVETPQRVVITTHYNPDADALGSSLGWAGYLRKKGHTVRVITPSEAPRFLAWMPGNEDVIEFSQRTVALAAQTVAAADVIFCLDFNALARLHDLEAIIRNSPLPKVMIDHHHHPEDFASIVISEPTAAATAQLIYQLINELGGKELLDVAIGECLYAGLMTDTGSFRHPSTNPAVHRMAAELIELGVNTNRIHRLIFDNNSLGRMQFLGYVLSQKLNVLPAYRAAYVALTAEELKRFNSQTGDTEGVVNYILSIENVVMAVLLIERDREVKLSFRSVGDVAVNEFARKHFNGGGHRNAAGGRTQESLDEAVTRLISLLPEIKDQLDEA
ncbi:DHH family phosphoesterase [Siphonobacter curvatus]|uniref:DHH family phosphoesterase n=1 Tax=Siphonobacter curvatus TaxID=2094562 RepID=A0A2S7IKZ9_9BACT|nr:bifunctional oligoribonuclease/PAP phosphatase NrnA [Siphonobacter curvatus]PQA58319.1 DHH family phosphoesterase [Siphonobacter curvatus]